MTPNPKKRLMSVLAAGLAIALAVPAVAEAAAIRAGFDANTLAANDDGSTGFVNFGFTIDFFGNSRSGGYVNNNGNVTLDSPLSTFTPFDLGTTSREILAPFFADVDTRASADVTYGTGSVGGNNAWGANWIDVGYYFNHSSPLNSFQLVIIDRSDIGAGDFDFEFNIDKILWETGDASGGSGGLGGSSARVGWSNGTGTTFELAGSAINGAFLDSNLTSGLIHNELDSGLSVGGLTSGRYFFQVRNGVVLPPSPAPEPGTMALLAIGLGMIRLRRRKR